MNDFLKLTHFIKVLNNRTNGFITAKRLKFKLQQILNLNISSGIIQSYRKKFLGMNYRRSRFKPKIFTQQEKEGRLLFAINMRNKISQNPTFISKLLFTDETTVKIGTSSIYHHRRPNNRPGVVGYKPSFCKNLNIWAGVTSTSATLPAIFSQTLNSHGFVSIIEEFLCPFIYEHEGCYVIQDNSRVHDSFVSKAALASNGVNLIRLPPYSPDINIIELLWHDLKHYVRAKPCFTYYEARHRVKKFFRYKLTPDKLLNYVNHFVNALDEANSEKALNRHRAAIQRQKKKSKKP